MPLLDHFHPPLSVNRPWEGFHSTWATVIAQQLNESVLPNEYVAIPYVRLGIAVEVDVAAMQSSGNLLPARTGDRTWAPMEPAWSVPVAWDQRDLFEVRILRQEDSPKLAGAIGLVSPAKRIG